ncbi:MAG: hypothetical protein JXA43_03350 [Candidatus Diapherotrites archaeon]|nr:hypothetical protein [Candidatus Diapherotrites archaeon]
MSLYDKIVEKTSPKKSLNIGFMNKVMLSGVVVVILVAIILILAVTTLSPQAITAEFLQDEISAGEQATLVVNIYNNSKEDLTNIHVNIKAVDPNALILTQNTIDVSILGVGEHRRVGIPVYTTSGVYEGTYSVELSTTSNQLEFQDVRAKITLK